MFIREHFAAGVLIYQDHYPGDADPTARMVVEVVIGGKFVSCIVDTGAPWCVLNPRLAQPLIDSGQAEELRTVTYIVRGYAYNGILFRLAIVLEDQSRASITVDATVFVPTVAPGDVWTHPNFLGLSGFLDRIRFAVDPAENAFYFGTD